MSTFQQLAYLLSSVPKRTENRLATYQKAEEALFIGPDAGQPDDVQHFGVIVDVHTFVGDCKAKGDCLMGFRHDWKRSKEETLPLI